MEALLFDLDDTLVVEVASANAAFLETCELAHERYGVSPDALRASVRETCRELWYRSPARQFCVDVGIGSWEGLWVGFAGDGRDLQILRDWAETYRLKSWSAALKRHRVDDPKLAAELAAAYIVNRRKRHVTFDDVHDVLAALGERYRLGLITNGLADQQREKIESTDIGSYFDAIMISGEIGLGKPHPCIFETILSRLEVPSQAATMIGNSLQSDIKGAQGAGIRAIWLNRDGVSRDDSVLPDREIRSLTELQNVLD